MPVLAVQLYSVRTEMAAHPEATLRAIAGMGYGAVEPTVGVVGDDPSAFREALDAAGLIACSLHGPVLTDRERVAAAARALGTDTVIIPAIKADGFADAESMATSAKRINEAAAWAGGLGLRLGYHNHHWELAQSVDGRPALEALADLLDDSVLLEVDLYWAAVGGVDVPELLKRLGERVSHLHVKDGPVTVDGAMTAVGAGAMPMEAVLAATPPAAWRIVELDRCDGDIMQALAASKNYLS